MARMALSHPVISVSVVKKAKDGAQFGSHSVIYEKQKEEMKRRRIRRQHHLINGRNLSAGVLYRKDIFYGGSLQNIPEYKYPT